MISSEILNKQLQEAIRIKLPKGANIASVLMDTLNIGKEAAYRRLRGEVQFSLYDAALISKKIGISLDSVIKSDYSGNLIFELKPRHFYDLRDFDYKMLEEYLEVLKYSSQEKHSSQVFTSNVFPQFPSHYFYQLGKYSSFRWMYLNHEPGSVLKTYQEMEFPDKLHRLNRNIIRETMNIKDTCYIWDSTIFHSIVKEIGYFHSIRLIGNEDINLLKEDLHRLLDFLENITSTGKFETGNKVQVYISNVYSDATYAYLETDHMDLSMIGAFSFNYVVSLEKKTLMKMKEQIHSMKRVSSLISESGEIQRIQFFKTQREVIDTL